MIKHYEPVTFGPENFDWLLEAAEIQIHGETVRVILKDLSELLFLSDIVYARTKYENKLKKIAESLSPA
jgi:hypothetical protein